MLQPAGGHNLTGGRRVFRAQVWSVKGEHILDPRTGRPAPRQERAWALTDIAGESDALSTACMVLREPELERVLSHRPDWLVLLDESELRMVGRRAVPRRAG